MTSNQLWFISQNHQENIENFSSSFINEYKKRKKDNSSTSETSSKKKKEPVYEEFIEQKWKFIGM